MKVEIVFGKPYIGSWFDHRWSKAHFKKNPPLKDFIDYLTSKPGNHQVYLDNFSHTNIKAVIESGCITKCDFTEDEMKKTVVLLGGISGHPAEGKLPPDLDYGIIFED